MPKQLFLDFDGTLVDSRIRQYELFQALVEQEVLSFAEYWRLKRQGLRQAELLQRYFHYTPDQCLVFKQAWMQSIEAPERLKTDQLFDHIGGFLSMASRTAKLYVVTARQHRDRLIAQMGWLQINQYFADVFHTAQCESKADVVRHAVGVKASDVFIGDTGEDVLAGKALGIRTVGVTWGATSAERLHDDMPDRVVHSVHALQTEICGEVVP